MSSTAKHTPGPWKASRLRVSDAKGNGIAQVTQRGNAPGHIIGEGTANARLIAAAPDLLLLAKAYERWEADLIECNAAWTNGLPRMTQALYDRFIEIQTMRNAAIAKAAPPDAVTSNDA